MVLPRINPTKSYWIESAPSPLREHRCTPTLPSQVDIVIIGSGYTGTTAAYWIHKFTQTHDRSPSILILEARDVCGGATGRNGGQLRPHAYSRYPLWKQRFGSAGAMSLIRHEMAHLSAFVTLLTEEYIEPETVSFKLGTTFDAAMDEDAFIRLKSAYNSMLADHGPENEIVSACYVVEGKEAEAKTQMKGCVGAVFHPAGQIWPYKFVHTLLRILLASKMVNLQASTPVLDVAEKVDEEGLSWVRTDRGIVKAKIVVHATNCWTSHLVPEFETLIRPTLATVAALEAPEALLKCTGAQHWGKGTIYNYHVQLPTPYNTIVVGGAKVVFEHRPSSYVDNDDEGRQIEGVPEYFHSWAKESITDWPQDMKMDFARDVRDGGCWTGVTATSSDGFPFVGTLHNRPGQFLAAGFSGHGMPRILLSTAHIASQVLRSLGVEYSIPKMAEDFPDLPAPFILTEERMTQVAVAIKLSQTRRN